MKKVFKIGSIALACGALSLSAGTVSAQTVSPVGGTGTVTGTIYLKHLLPSTSTCTLTGLPVSATSSSTVVTTWSGNKVLCTQPLLVGVTAAPSWTVTQTGPTSVTIQTQRINTILGWCPPKLLTASVVSKTPTSVTLDIPYQTWAGQSSGTCEVSGTVTVNGITL